MKRGKKILALFLIITMLLPFVMNIPAEAAEKSKQLPALPVFLQQAIALTVFTVRRSVPPAWAAGLPLTPKPT